MGIKNFFKIDVKDTTCIAGLSEDSVRQLVDSIEITVSDPSFSGFVQSTNGTNVKFNFGSDGNFNGVTAKLNSKNITLIHGAGSNELSIFKGAPSALSPGAGWTVEVDLTKKYLNQPDNQLQWEIFYASRTQVLNTF